MLINQDFSVDRSKYIGGSDIGAILGLSRFRSPLEVWMEKTGKETKKLDSLPLRFGSFAEEFVATEYASATGFELVHDESIYIHPEHSFMSAHIDRFVLENGSSSPTRILECKTANPFSSGDWGEVGSDEVPMSYLCQCIWYMAITNLNKVDLAVLFGNSDFRIYEIARDLELENAILEKASLFWHEYVLKDLPPPAQSEADCQALFSKGDPSKSVEAKAQTFELTKRLQLLNSEIDVREEEISTIKQNIMNQMGEAESLLYQGKMIATWKAPKPSFRLDSKRLEQDLPDIANNYKMPVQNSRRLVIKQIN
ncbi:YqaJ viral recombinase family protein [Polynucleobacter sp. JS-Mosq-20-D10]|uniref:YqaJ viral recombinase family nuclease n=1 Tax=Polynucleobacter sp. JS-Mosq-20-D10 TaxID=2576922 RepID=UPI001BFE3673|nr:YqaJ viral recombinase family protein [Polynucleobacter sp. JS-Mosq-20-D10]QWE01122.1 YqaJ viral recombinase family protein [Polynucleobacter sp. JS-Mosq-20-D10]